MPRPQNLWVEMSKVLETQSIHTSSIKSNEGGSSDNPDVTPILEPR